MSLLPLAWAIGMSETAGVELQAPTPIAYSTKRAHQKGHLVGYFDVSPEFMILFLQPSHSDSRRHPMLWSATVLQLFFGFLDLLIPDTPYRDQRSCCRPGIRARSQSPLPNPGAFASRCMPRCPDSGLSDLQSQLEPQTKQFD